MYESLVQKLHKEYTLHGYITEQQIFSEIERNNIPLFEVEHICDQLLSKGVIIRDIDDDEDDSQDEYDRSTTDYQAIYNSVLEIDPSLAPFIEFVEAVQAPQHREWQNLLPQAQNGNIYAKTRICEMYMRAVVKTALTLSAKYDLELADTIQDGLIGLYIAIDKFEFGRQDVFPTYFPFWVRQSIMREATTRNPSVYFPVHVKEKLFSIYDIVDRHICESCGKFDPCSQLISQIASKAECCDEDAEQLYKYMIRYESIEDLIDNDENAFSDLSDTWDSIIESLDSVTVSDNIMDAINSSLTEREREVILRRFGFGNYEVHTLEMIGYRMNITRERVRQIEAKAIRKLKRNRKIRIKD